MPALVACEFAHAASAPSHHASHSVPRSLLPALAISNFGQSVQPGAPPCRCLLHRPLRQCSSLWIPGLNSGLGLTTFVLQNLLLLPTVPFAPTSRARAPAPSLSLLLCWLLALDAQADPVLSLAHELFAGTSVSQSRVPSALAMPYVPRAARSKFEGTVEGVIYGLRALERQNLWFPYSSQSV